MASIELRCSICPQNPTFSDQSHLLTHIGSKGHLSHYFKAQVRSRQDPVMRNKLLGYDAWYTNSEIDKLLSQRLMVKESKRSSRKGPNMDSSALVINSRRKKRKTRNIQGDRLDEYATNPENEFIDPKLASATIPPRVVRADRMASSSAREDFDSNSKRAPTAPMHFDPGMEYVEQHGTSTRYPLCSATQGTLGDRCPSNSNMDFSFKEAQSDLSQPDQMPQIPGPFFEEQRGGHSGYPWILRINHEDSVEEEEGKEQSNGNEVSKLKGVIWPGMDLFDTADEDSKRKRNQKKNNSTLIQMQSESEMVEQMELIYFYPSWDLKQARFISGEVESSPPREPTPKPKINRTRRARAPLANLDPNVPNNDKRQRSSKVIRRFGRDKDSNGKGLGLGENANRRQTNQEITNVEQGEARRRGFTVYQDATPLTQPNHGEEDFRAMTGAMCQNFKDRRGHAIINADSRSHTWQNHAYESREEDIMNTNVLSLKESEQWFPSGLPDAHGLNDSYFVTSLRRHIESQDQMSNESRSNGSAKFTEKSSGVMRNRSPRTNAAMSCFMDYPVAQSCSSNIRRSNPLVLNISQSLRTRGNGSDHVMHGFGHQAGPSNGYLHRSVVAATKQKVRDDSSGDETIDQGIEEALEAN